MGKRAIILGATGATGKALLNLLFLDSDYVSIKVFSRKTVGLKNEKLEEIICDLLDLDKVKQQFKSDIVFCCIGTTLKKTPDKELYRKIDFGIPVNAAKLCLENEIPEYLVVSAMGANSQSKIFYNKTKGDMEDALMKLGLKHLYIFRPSLISAKRNEFRLGESIGNAVMSIMDWMMVGNLKKYRRISADNIALAMLHVSHIKPSKTVFTSDMIQELANSGNN